MINLNDATPAATSGNTNVSWQKDTSGNVSAQIVTPAPATRTISTTAPLTGGGDLSADRTIAIASQSANQVLAGPTTGSAAAPTFRTLVSADMPAGLGTVTSVALTTPSWLSVSGTPVTTSGTLAVTATSAQTANRFLATPDGSAGTVGLRAIEAADLPLATTGAFGAVKPDGTTITISGGVITSTAAGGMTNPMTTTGDLIVGGSSGTPTRVGAGTSGYVWTANGAGVAPSWQAASSGGSLLYGLGTFGSNGQGTLAATYSNTGSITFGTLTSTQIDATHTVTTAAGHIYRIVFYVVGGTGGANLCLIQAGTSGGSSAGYFVASSGIYKAVGSSITSIQSSGYSQGQLADPYAQIVEIYVWVRGSSNNTIWARGFGSFWQTVSDTSCDFATHSLELGICLGSSPSAVTAIYAYDLGAVPTS